MCIRILNSCAEVKYDSTRPLEEQIKGHAKVVVEYEQKDSDIDVFLSEMKRLCKNGIKADISVEVLHNNQLKGVRTKREVKKLMKELDMNEAIKLLVILHHTTDRHLEELAVYCQKH